MLGELPCSGIGSPAAPTASKPLGLLRSSVPESNQRLLSKLRKDAHGEELLAATRDDASVGRMSDPVPPADFDTDGALLHPRFANVRLRDDGSQKIRAVDHFSWSAFGEKKNGGVSTVPPPQLKK